MQWESHIYRSDEKWLCARSWMLPIPYGSTSMLGWGWGEPETSLLETLGFAENCHVKLLSFWQGRKEGRWICCWLTVQSLLAYLMPWQSEQPGLTLVRLWTYFQQTHFPHGCLAVEVEQTRQSCSPCRLSGSPGNRFGPSPPAPAACLGWLASGWGLPAGQVQAWTSDQLMPPPPAPHCDWNERQEHLTSSPNLTIKLKIKKRQGQTPLQRRTVNSTGRTEFVPANHRAQQKLGPTPEIPASFFSNQASKCGRSWVFQG